MDTTQRYIGECSLSSFLEQLRSQWLFVYFPLPPGLRLLSSLSLASACRFVIFDTFRTLTPNIINLRGDAS